MDFIIDFINCVFFQVLATSNTLSKSLPKDEPQPVSSSEAPSTTPTPPPAIIAIEIIDPNENKTTTKNSKRTIESNLGYGNHAVKPAKFEIYKYSQHDIPPYKGSGAAHYTGLTPPPQNEAVPYAPGVQQQPVYHQNQAYTHGQDLNQYYQPGTTLYTTLNSQGHLGGLSPHAPFQGGNVNAPVIVLRVHPDQLAGLSAGGLYPNLPQSNPFAHSLNNIDLQSLLGGYVQNLAPQQPLPQQAYPAAPGLHNYQPSGFQGGYNQGYDNQQYYQPALYQQQPQQFYQDPNQGAYQQQVYQEQPQQLQTYENYPDDKHTKVVFKEASQPSGPPSSTGQDYPTNEDNKEYDGSAEEEEENYKPVGPLSSETFSYSPEKEAARHYDAGGNFGVSDFLPTSYGDYRASGSNRNQQYGEVPPVASDKGEHHNYHVHGARNKKSSNIRMRIPKSLKKKEANRDKRENLE